MKILLPFEKYENWILIWISRSNFNMRQMLRTWRGQKIWGLTICIWVVFWFTFVLGLAWLIPPRTFPLDSVQSSWARDKVPMDRAAIKTPVASRTKENKLNRSITLDFECGPLPVQLARRLGPTGNIASRLPNQFVNRIDQPGHGIGNPFHFTTSINKTNKYWRT